VTKRQVSVKEGQVFTCSNPVCGRTFSVPLKVVDARLNDHEPYSACPHCLGRIASDVCPRDEDSATNVSVDNVNIKREQSTDFGRSVEGPVAKCAYHLGFLNERSSQDKIPEDCMVCENIVKCMLKSIRD
jgi:hypothetical protein